jgi:hypothetical protein
VSGIRREFVGWDQPASPVAARRLADRGRRGRTLDLGRVIVVVPGQRAGRRLQELLAFHAEDEGLRLTPPEVLTEGQLPEKLYTPRRPFADDLTQDLAWARALRDLPADRQRHIVPRPPDATDAVRWLQLGKLLRGLHVELAADGLDFADVHEKGHEAERWRALTEVQHRYHRLLDAEQLWDKQTARLVAVKRGEIRTEAEIILLAAVDLNNTLRQMLDQVAEHVAAYVIAPEPLADRFDAHGCLIPGAWLDAEVPLRDEQLQQVDGPVEQADAVSAWLARLGGRFRTDEVAIGVPDESLVPQLQGELEQCGARTRWVEGMRLAETAPYRLLAAAVKFAGGGRYDDLAALLRHPDLENRLPRSAPATAVSGRPGAQSLPAQLDRFYSARLPSRVRSGSVLENRDWPDLGPAVQWVEEWLAEAAAKQPLRAWGGTFRRMLGSVYGDRTLNLDTPADEALHRATKIILAACDRLEALPAGLDAVALSAADAFAVALAPLADESLPPPTDPEAVEILGWLELPLDDSRALIVASFNEGFVPQSTAADPFLPDGLRRELRLLHNERRYARDAYATSVLCCSREELRVLIARRRAQDEPLHPSRLVFACVEAVMVQRARRLFGARASSASPRRLLLAPEGRPIPDKSLFAVPRPVPPGAKPLRIAVSEFKAYLACPYRYYLRHVRKLAAVDDAARELDGGAFVTLLHRVLRAFGRDPSAPRHSERRQDLCNYLDERLQALAKDGYGSDHRRPAIRLQLEQARRRLHAFASHQVKLVQEGWRILYAEDEEDIQQLEVPFTVDGEPITLVGRIDRIDLHEPTRAVRILDYKAADTARTPEQTHRKGAGWIDLQLPLYRHLWHDAPLDAARDCNVELGYFNLPKSEDKAGLACAEWDDAMLATADAAARKVIRQIRAHVFEPRAPVPPCYSEDLAAICLDNWLSGPALADEGTGGPA